MNELTFASDFSLNVLLDSQLTGTSGSGLYWNRGVHPLITVNNLVSLLPFMNDITFLDYNPATTYGIYTTTKEKTDVVTYEGTLYQSIVTANTGNQPDISSDEWLPTNKESLVVKSFIWTVEESMLSGLGLQKSLIENQFIYNVGKNTLSLPNDFSGWVIEPRGSDYVDIKINQICLQALTTDPVNLYVVNQGVLIDTLVLNPQNGVLQFEDLNYTITGKGRFYFVFASQDVRSSSPSVDILKYGSFVANPVSGIGASAAEAIYTDAFTGNGLNFNISVIKNPAQYVTNNLVHFARLLQVQFEVDFIRMLLANANVRSGRTERILSDGRFNESVLYNEITNLDAWTIAKRYKNILDETKLSLDRTLDKEINSGFELTIKSGTL